MGSIKTKLESFAKLWGRGRMIIERGKEYMNKRMKWLILLIAGAGLVFFSAPTFAGKEDKKEDGKEIEKKEEAPDKGLDTALKAPDKGLDTAAEKSGGAVKGKEKGMPVRDRALTREKEDFKKDDMIKDQFHARDERLINGIAVAKEGLKDAIDSAQMQRERARLGVQAAKQDLKNARESLREIMKYTPERAESSGAKAWVDTATERYDAAKDTAQLIRQISRIEVQKAAEKFSDSHHPGQ